MNLEFLKIVTTSSQRIMSASLVNGLAQSSSRQRNACGLKKAYRDFTAGIKCSSHISLHYARFSYSLKISITPELISPELCNSFPSC